MKSIEDETFILDVLDEEPEKYQLWYCLGLVNYYKKEDYECALEYFNNFIKEEEFGKLIIPEEFTYTLTGEERHGLMFRLDLL